MVDDPVEAGQSDAAARGVAAAIARGAERVLLVPGDCPALDPGEVGRLLDGYAGAALVIVPDRHGSGTNALLIAPPGAIEPSFGPARSRATPRSAPPPAWRCGSPRRRRSRWTSTPRAISRRCARALRAAGRGAAHARAARGDGAGAGRRVTGRPRRRSIAEPLPGLPEIRPGDDLAALLAEAARGWRTRAARDRRARGRPQGGGQGRGARRAARRRRAGRAGARAGRRAREGRAPRGADPARERRARARRRGPADRAHAPRVRVRERRRGPVQRRRRGSRRCSCPRTRTASARALRARLGCAIVIGDSFGRAWRVGQAEVAIGCAGLAPLEDWRGRPDSAGRRAARDARRARRPGRRPPPTSCAARTRASRPCGCAGSSATCWPRTGRAPRRCCGGRTGPVSLEAPRAFARQREAVIVAAVDAAHPAAPADAAEAPASDRVTVGEVPALAKGRVPGADDLRAPAAATTTPLPQSSSTRRASAAPSSRARGCRSGVVPADDAADVARGRLEEPNALASAAAESAIASDATSAIVVLMPVDLARARRARCCATLLALSGERVTSVDVARRCGVSQSTCRWSSPVRPRDGSPRAPRRPCARSRRNSAPPQRGRPGLKRAGGPSPWSCRTSRTRSSAGC